MSLRRHPFQENDNRNKDDQREEGKSSKLGEDGSNSKTALWSSSPRNCASYSPPESKASYTECARNI